VDRVMGAAVRAQLTWKESLPKSTGKQKNEIRIENFVRNAFNTVVAAVAPV